MRSMANRSMQCMWNILPSVLVEDMQAQMRPVMGPRVFLWMQGNVECSALHQAEITVLVVNCIITYVIGLPTTCAT